MKAIPRTEARLNHRLEDTEPFAEIVMSNVINLKKCGPRCIVNARHQLAGSPTVHNSMPAYSEDGMFTHV